MPGFWGVCIEILDHIYLKHFALESTHQSSIHFSWSSRSPSAIEELLPPKPLPWSVGNLTESASSSNSWLGLSTPIDCLAASHSSRISLLSQPFFGLYSMVEETYCYGVMPCDQDISYGRETSRLLSILARKRLSLSLLLTKINTSGPRFWSFQGMSDRVYVIFYDFPWGELSELRRKGDLFRFIKLFIRPMRPREHAFYLRDEGYLLVRTLKDRILVPLFIPSRICFLSFRAPFKISCCLFPEYGSWFHLWWKTLLTL